jgi:hypothetical protein
MTTLGPPGVGIVEGARVRTVHYPDHGRAVVGAVHDGKAILFGVLMPIPVAGLCLDLSGPLEHGTRALLRLLRPEEPEPRCAPGWTREGNKLGWRLWHDDDDILLIGSDYWRERGEHVVPGIEREIDPGEALALALAAVAGRTP